jgi:hypothetical protein
VTGARVFFETTEKLVADDRDGGSSDVYQRSGQSTRLISTGPAGGDGAFAASFVGASKEGASVFFETKEKLVAGDGDVKTDVYMRLVGVRGGEGASTTLVSIGANGGSGAFDASFAESSADGSRAFFITNERLAPDDTDLHVDIYERSVGSGAEFAWKARRS